MSQEMVKLAKKYVDAVKRPSQIIDEIVSLLRVTDYRYKFDEAGRELILRQMQRELYRVIGAEKIAEIRSLEDESPDDLYGEVDRILDMATDQRTVEEKKMYVALRVRWLELMRKAGVRALSRNPQR